MTVNVITLKMPPFPLVDAIVLTKNPMSSQERLFRSLDLDRCERDSLMA